VGADPMLNSGPDDVDGASCDGAPKGDDGASCACAPNGDDGAAPNAPPDAPNPPPVGRPLCAVAGDAGWEPKENGLEVAAEG